MIKEKKSIKEEIQHRIDFKTKPPGSLGRLEEIALQIGVIQGTKRPQLSKPTIVVFAGDHGIAATGLVNPYPQEVTAQMVLNFLHGGAAINVFCRQNEIELKVVDAGVNFDFGTALENQPGFIHAKMGMGTKNYLEHPAMSHEEARASLSNGAAIVTKIFDEGSNTIGFGEMGIANTSSAALIMSAITGIPIGQCVGKGTGTNSQQLETKIQTLRKVFDKHQERINRDPLEILMCFGGFEIAMMAGAYCKAFELGMVIVVDGFISTAALLCAQLIEPNILNNCIFAHTSGEQGHQSMLSYLHAQPLLNLGLRLGEGTGAALAIPLLQSAVNFLNEMASFESAGVSNKN